MELPDFIRMIWRHWKTIALCCLSATASAVLITYAVDDTYKASTLVLITPQPEVAVVGNAGPKELLSFPVSSVGVSTQTETSTKTYTELIKSRTVVERVVRNLGLDQAGDSATAAGLFERLKKDLKRYAGDAVQILMYGRRLEGDPLENVIEKLAGRISVSPTRNSYVFSIDCVWDDPQVAARIVDETASRFVELLNEITKGHAAKVTEFVGQRMRDSESELADARRALQAYKERAGSVDFDTETEEEIRLISTLEASLESLDSRLSGLQGQLTSSNPKALQLQAERDSLAGSIARRRAAMDVLPDAEARLAKLELSLTASEEVYRLITLEFEQAQIREANTASDIQVVARAVVPQEPVGPIKVLYAAVACLIALLVGIGGALAYEAGDTTLRSVEQVRAVLDLPVLATVPSIRRRPGRVARLRSGLPTGDRSQ